MNASQFVDLFALVDDKYPNAIDPIVIGINNNPPFDDVTLVATVQFIESWHPLTIKNVDFCIMADNGQIRHMG